MLLNYLKKNANFSNDYEVLVNVKNRDEYPINHEIDVKVNSHKLKVVGYYSCLDKLDAYLTNSNTIKYSLIINKSDLTVLSTNMNKTLKKTYKRNKW